MRINPVSSVLVGAILASTWPALLAGPTVFNFMAAPGDACATLTWNGSAGDRGYNVKQATTADGPFTLIATNQSQTALVITNLRNSTVYYFAISSTSDGLESADTPRLRMVPSAPVLDLLPAGAKLEKLASGFAATEGPVWDPARGYLLFSDSPNSRLLQWTPGSGVTIFRQKSNRASGNTLDLQGRLISCEGATRSVTRTEPDGTVTPLVTLYQGKKLNEPNDVVVKSDGTIWFTDPTFTNPKTQPGYYVYRFDPADGNGTITAVATNLNLPNGLCFSLDEANLFVADIGKAEIRAFDVLPDNTLTNSRVFVPEGADGMRISADGRLLTCTFIVGSSMRVFDPDGRLRGTLTVPEPPTNLCFGGTNREMLFITASTSLYGITRMPDLIVTSINRFPTNPVSGQPVVLGAVIKNQGTRATLEGVPIRVTFSVDGETNSVWTEFTSSIPPDASIIVSASNSQRTRPWIAVAGAHSVRAIVDSSNAHRESNENNNSLTLNLTVDDTVPDSDGDGSDDLDEANAGTDPSDPISSLQIVSARRLAGNGLTLTWSSVPGINYRLSRQSSLSDGEDAEFTKPISASTGMTSWTNSLPFTHPIEFLRIQVVP